MENLVEDNGICDCHYLLTMRLALQKEVDSPFGINSIYDLGDWCAPWWRKPVSYADLDAFFESHGCGWLRQSIGIGSWRGVAGEGEKAERIIRTSLEQHGEFKDGWEFPGGKIEPDETPEHAIIREIKEELDTEIEVIQLLDTVEYDYPKFHLSMDCFICHIKSGDLVLKEHEAAKWLTKKTLYSVDWLPADQALIGKIEKYLEEHA